MLPVIELLILGTGSLAVSYAYTERFNVEGAVPSRCRTIIFLAGLFYTEDGCLGMLGGAICNYDRDHVRHMRPNWDKEPISTSLSELSNIAVQAWGC